MIHFSHGQARSKGEENGNTRKKNTSDGQAKFWPNGRNTNAAARPSAAMFSGSNPATAENDKNITAATNAGGVVSQAFTANATGGNYTVTATAAGVSTPASFALTNTQPFGPIDHFAVVPTTTTVVAGAGVAVQIIAQDASNRTVLTYASSVTLTSNDPLAPTPGGPVTMSGGVGAATVVLKTATGSGWTITATAGSITGASPAVVVTPAAAAKFTLTSAAITTTAAITATGATESGTVVTITTAAAHGFRVGQAVNVSGVGVAGYNGATGAFSLSVTGGGGVLPPANDDCANRQGVSLGTTSFNSTGASTDGDSLFCSGTFQVYNDLWYNYPSQCTGNLTISTCGSAFDTRLAVLSGAGCGNQQARLLSCSDNDGSCGTGSRITIPVVAGQNYTIRVGGATAAAQGAGSLTLSCNLPCSPDFNGDGSVDFFDYDDYVQCFETGTCPAGRDAGPGGGCNDRRRARMKLVEVFLKYGAPWRGWPSVGVPFEPAGPARKRAEKPER